MKKIALVVMAALAVLNVSMPAFAAQDSYECKYVDADYCVDTNSLIDNQEDN